MSENSVQRYRVTINRHGDFQGEAKAREHSLILSTKKGEARFGFNAAETLMAALGACLMTNLTSLSEKMRLHVDDIRIVIDAVRFDDPPGIVELSYVLTLESPEPEDKLRQLHELSVKWGTVTNTLLHGVEPKGVLKVERPPISPLDFPKPMGCGEQAAELANAIYRRPAETVGGPPLAEQGIMGRCRRCAGAPMGGQSGRLTARSIAPWPARKQPRQSLP